MRRLLCVASLLLSIWAMPSHALICPDGVSRAASTSLCPANVSSLGVAQITTTSVQVNGQVDVQGRGAFSRAFVSLSIYPPGCTSANVTGLTFGTQPYDAAIAACARADLIRAATGASATASETLVDWGYHAKTVSGLAPGTQYYAHVQTYGGGCNPYPNYTVGCTRPSAISLVKTIGFTTAASGGGGGEQTVADGGASARYIGNSGNDLLDGLTPANRWANPSKVSCSLPAGTNIAFLNTSTFSNAAAQLDLCFDSTSNDWAVVGAYRLNGSSVPVWAADGIRGPTETDQKASFVGNITQGCIDARNCAFTQATFNSAGMSSQYDPPLSITGSYVEVRNLDYSLWPGYVFIVSGSGNTSAGDTGPGSTHHVIIDGLDMTNIGSGPFTFVDGFKDGVVRNSTATTWGLCWQLKSLGNSGANSDYVCDGSAVPSVGGLVRSYNGRLLVEGNDWVGGIGEGGVDCGARSSHMIYRDNRLYGAQSVGQYADGCSKNLSEANIFIGGTDHGVQGAGETGPGTGLSASLAIDIESWQGSNADSTNDFIARNNLQIRPGYCTSMAINSVAAAAGKTVGMRMHGNLCIGSNTTDFQQWTPIAGDDIQVLDIKNNVYWNQSTNIWNISQFTSIANNHSYTARTSNGGTSATTGDPQLVTSYATWATYKGHATWPTFAMAIPSPGSPLIDSGVATEAPIMTWAEFGFAATEMAPFKAGQISAEHWIKERYYSATNQVLGATPPKGPMCPAAGC